MGVEAFAERLRELRAAKEWTQTELAEAAEVPVTSLRNWEQGRRLPELGLAGRLARALGANLDDLALLADDLPPPKKRGR